VSCSAPELAAVAARLAGGPLAALVPAAAGGNSRIYRVELADGTLCALKSYPRPAGDPRDRLGTEYGALSFLAAQGIAEVPRPLACDPSAGLALYQWIEGRRPPAGPESLDAMAAFCARLHALREAPGAAALPDASEACPSPAEICRQIHRRLERLQALSDETTLQAFLARELLPLLEQAEAAGELSTPGPRSLSPSDFGLHNMLLRAGRPVFIDFEYFGWDDPVKLVADVVWHPAMALPEPLARRFVAATRRLYGATDADFKRRLALSFPLYGLRWALIVLNEFLPERWAVRAHAGARDQAAAKRRQLDKARTLLERVRRPFDLD
jgi:hypothetical protein